MLSINRFESPRVIYRILLGLGFSTLALVIPVAIRVGVDPYHEGALFPSAVGVAEGLHIFSEVNNQYGFMYAVIQAPFLFFFGNYLLVSRIVGVIVLFISVIILYLLIRRIWSQQVSLLVALACAALNPSWSYLSITTLSRFGAWINQYGILLILVSVLLTLKVAEKRTQHPYLLLSAGALSLLATFVRLDFFFVWVLQFLFLISSERKGKFTKKFLVLWIVGGLLAGIISITYLLIIGSFSDFFNQLIMVWFSAPPNSAHLGLGNLLTFSFSCLLFLLYFIGIHLLSRYRKSWLYITVFTLLTIFFLNLSLPILSRIVLGGKIIGPYLQTSADGFLLNFSSVLVAILIIATFAYIRSKRKVSSFSTSFLQITSVGLLVQLHNVNSAYIFMLNPVLLTWFMYWLAEHKETNPKMMASLRNTFISLIAISLLIALSLTFQKTYSYKTGLLKGLTSNSIDTRNSIDSKFKLLDKYVSVGYLYFDCPYGLYAVSSNGLYTADKWTWNEIPNAWLKKSISRAKTGDFLLVCGGDQERVVNYKALILEGEIRLIDSLPEFRLYKVT